MFPYTEEKQNAKFSVYVTLDYVQSLKEYLVSIHTFTTGKRVFVYEYTNNFLCAFRVFKAYQALASLITN